MNYIFGVVFLLCCIFIVILITQCNVYTKKENEMNILQVFDPDPDTLFELYQRGLPIIIQKELQNWDGIDLLIGLDYDTIKTTVQENMKDVLSIIKGNLQFHNNVLSYDWKIDLTMVDMDINSPIFPIKQVNIIQLFATVTGETRVILFSPNMETYLEPFTNNVSSVDIKSEIEKDDTKINFIEIVLREGNILYIPYGWHYFIYGNHLDLDNDESEQIGETVILDCINKSLVELA